MLEAAPPVKLSVRALCNGGLFAFSPLKAGSRPRRNYRATACKAPAANRLRTLTPPYYRKSMKYEVRWSNGFWKTFDRSRYESVAVHGTQAEAIIAVAKANR
jgi:hypothetical protein